MQLDKKVSFSSEETMVLRAWQSRNKHLALSTELER